MIIQYDTRPNATIDEKLRSLIHSIQLALGEIGIREDSNVTSQNTDITALSVVVRQLIEDLRTYADTLSGIEGRVTALEARQELPTAPVYDGSYALKVTVIDGVPTYTWEVDE